MNKKSFVFYLCLITLCIFILVALLFADILKNPSQEQTPDTGTDPTVSDSQSSSSDEKQPTENEQTVDKEPDTDTQTKEPEKTDDSTDVTEQKKPTVNTSDKDQEDTSSADNNQAVISTPIKSGNGNYKEFTLLEGMSAKEAYEYLDSFLNSKYSILINKQNKVSSDYAPSNLRTPSGTDYKLEDKAATALENMLKDAKKAGYTDLVFYSGYRTYASQKNKYETRTQKYINQGYSQADAEAKAGEYIAPPGSSEHHTGLAADVCSSSIVNKYGYLSDEFDKTNSWKWLSDNCSSYGFILRYRKDAESITGFSYEPWHFRYIGVDHAKACTDLGYTYEEYYNMIVKYRDAAKADAGV